MRARCLAVAVLLLLAACGSGTGRPHGATAQAWSQVPNAPLASALQGTAQVWTGTELLVWGGADFTAVHADGAAYDPAKHTWRTMAPSPLGARSHMAAVWTGHQMILWGGSDSGVKGGHATDGGAAYDPATDSWSLLPPAPLTGRQGARATWTGRQMVVLGGSDGRRTNPLDGAAYDPTTRTWQRIKAPTPPVGDLATWDFAVASGNRLYAWDSGQGPSVDGEEGAFSSHEYLLDPSTLSWRLAADQGPLAAVFSAVSGPDGIYVTGELSPHPILVSGGVPIADPEPLARLDPVSGTWTSLPPKPGTGDLFVTDTGTLLTQIGPTQFAEASADRHSWSDLPASTQTCGDGGTPVLAGTRILYYCPASDAAGQPPNGLEFTTG